MDGIGGKRRRFRDPAAYGYEIVIGDDAMIERNEHERLARSSIRWAQGEHGRHERTMNARRAVMRGGAPHAVIHPDGRRDIAAGDAGAAVTLWEYDLVHRDSRITLLRRPS